MRTQQQSGSVIVFTLVGIVLAAAVVGGIIMAQKRGSTATVATQPASQQQDGRVDGDAPKSEKEKKAEEKAKKDAEAKKKAEAEKKAKEKKANEQKSEEQKAKERAAREKREAEEKRLAEQAAEAERTQQDQTPAPASDATVSPGPIARTGGPHPGGLPETGPVEDMLAAVFGLVAIFGAGYVYYHYGRK